MKSTINRLSKSCRFGKKTIIYTFTIAVMCIICSVTAFADAAGFAATASDAMKRVVTLIGAGLGIWGIVNLIEGYGNDNPGAKSQGIKQLMAGIALVAVAQTLVGNLSSYM